MRTVRKPPTGRQFAALPYVHQDGETLVMMVTSRDTGRWVLPKGWAEKGLSGPELAEKEAFEEAGLVGEIASTSIGRHTYLKQLGAGQQLECKVVVFPMRVEQLLEDWPEAQERKREWFTLGQAAMNVDEAELVTLLLKLAQPSES